MKPINLHEAGSATLSYEIQKLNLLYAVTVYGKCKTARKSLRRYLCGRTSINENPSAGDVADASVPSRPYAVLTAILTRWSSFHRALCRLLQLRMLITPLTTALVDLAEFQNFEWGVAKWLNHLLEPFTVATTDLQGDSYPTLSRILPYLAQLKAHLQHANFQLHARGPPPVILEVLLLFSS